LLVNPYDIEGIANAIYQAANMSINQRQMRMYRLRKSVRRRDLFWWLNSFLQAAD
ncbi:MAG: trehalose-6-phosphate synthase, partial [Dehalococcoidia bacterium]|nr:trehalose-6-phosphate synthase [Dehalococcoidia bacterium]